MTDFLLAALQHPFTWGLFAGLVPAALQLKKNWELKARVKTLESHVIKGHEASLLAHGRLQDEVDSLRAANQNLRDKLAQFAHSPRGQLANQLDAFQRAVAILTKEAPGFAQAFSGAIEKAQAEIAAEIEGSRRPPFGLGGLLPFFQPKPAPLPISAQTAPAPPAGTGAQNPGAGA